jgi:lipopolysaccharide export system protein LptC
VIARARGVARQEQVSVARDPRPRAYNQARRHSVRVRFLKYAIPTAALLALGLLVVVPLLIPSVSIGGLTLGPFSLTGTKITMERPRLTGFRKDSRSYEVTASAATQDVRKPNVIELQDMRARLAIDDNGGMARMEAITGIFDTQKEHLELRQDVRVRTDSGQSADLRSAFIDFKAGTVVSREPVTVRLTNGVIEANAMEITDNGKIIAFTGGVKTVFEVTETEPKAAGNAKVPVAAELVQPAAAQTSPNQPAGVR